MNSTWSGILQYFPTTRNYILLDEYFQGQAPASFIYYANNDIYLISSGENQAYVAQLGGIPMPINQFVSATALSFFEVTMSVLNINTNTTDNGFEKIQVEIKLKIEWNFQVENFWILFLLLFRT